MDVKYAGVDWLTMTTKDAKVGYQWYNTYQKYKGVRRQDGDEEKPFHNGFYGGVRIASMSVGHSESIGYIVIVSGGDAERLFQRLMPGKKRVTRLDLCIDFYFERPKKLASKLYGKLQSDSTNKQRKSSLFVGNDGSETLYIGSRLSQQYGRLYDKGVQLKTTKPGHLWRAEVEYKKPKSGSLAKSLAAVKPEERVLSICDTVCEWYSERGVELFPWDNSLNSLHIGVQQRVITADKKLAWLRNQVQPTVAQLISAGYGRDVFEALLLDTEAISRAFTIDS